MILDERLGHVGLACAASLGATIPRLAAQQTPAQLWEQISLSYPRIDPARRLADAQAAGWRILTPGDVEWPPPPPGLPDIGETPWALWVRGDGDLRTATRRSVAVIGGRGPTSYGAHVSAVLGEDLSRRDWTVVAACALGCDEQALAAASRGATPPIAVYAAGGDLQTFQRRHSLDLHGGLLVSDAPPDIPTRRERFLARQDLITYLSAGIVIVEAGWKGPALATVSYARRRGRHVMAVPGPVTSSASVVCHHLIRDHTATLVDSGDAISVALLHAATAAAGPAGSSR